MGESETTCELRSKVWGLVQNVPWNILEHEKWDDIQYVGHSYLETQGVEVAYKVKVPEDDTDKDIEVGGFVW